MNNPEMMAAFQQFLTVMNATPAMQNAVPPAILSAANPTAPVVTTGFKFDATTLALVIASWDSASGTNSALEKAVTAHRATSKTVASELNKAAKLAGVVGESASDVFLTGVRDVLAAHNTSLGASAMTDGAFRKLWSRALGYAFAEKDAALVKPQRMVDDGRAKRADILKGAAKDRIFDRVAARSLITAHLQDDAFLVNAVKLIEGLTAGKETLRIEKAETLAPVAAPVAAPVIAEIQPKARASRSRKTGTNG